ncbi:MAG TPA: site-specific integrase [Rhodocyclaceae bacterium]|nr:site-specific integrase [Rhodocyclaceae bacterium]HNC60198.1 site-specific integrase [Rhodocyclaceae bacterium]
MRLQTNLVRRGARYYFRSRVPEDLKPHYGKSEFLISLKTSNRGEAERALVALRAQLFEDYARLRGQPSAPTLPRLQAKGNPQTQAARLDVELQQLVDYWKSQGQRAPRTLLEVDSVVHRFLLSTDACTVAGVARKHIVEFKDQMLALGKSVATVKKYLGLLSAIFETAVANERLDANPVTGVKLRRPKVREKARVPFSADELNRIFSSPVFTQGLRPTGGKGEAAHWLPLLALWTGARLEELGQLRTDDVRTEAGIAFIYITDDPDTGRRIKTTGSRRRVPIHPELVRLGFLNFVTQQGKAHSQRLFPLLQPSREGSVTKTWSQWFGRYLRASVGISDSRKVFHSLRHGFKDACRESGIPKEVHDRLTGHSSGSIGDTYGSDTFPLAPLADAVSRLRYAGVELSFPAWGSGIGVPE